MSQETKPTTSPETQQNTELVAKIRAVIEGHAIADPWGDEFIPELDFDDLAQAIAETFPATNVPAGNDSLRGACYRLCSSESVACTCAATEAHWNWLNDHYSAEEMTAFMDGKWSPLLRTLSSEVKDE